MNNILKQSISALIAQEKEIHTSLFRLSIVENNLGRIDGKIIGTGQADYTQNSLDYELTINNRKFLLIDIPGIEGNESKYREIIKNALSRAHVIFYVKGEGKKIEATSLEKIKAYMHDKTSLYAVFNIHCNGKKNRIAGIDKATYREELFDAYDQHKEIVLQTEQELKPFLGEHYKGNVLLNGLLAFSSLALDDNGNTTIINDVKKQLLSQQTVFLKEFSDNEQQMRTDSQIEKIQGIIVDKLANYDEYIRKENLKKLNNRLSETISEITRLNDCEKTKIAGFIRDYNDFEQSCALAKEEFIRSINLLGRAQVEAAFYPVQEELFQIIEEEKGKTKESTIAAVFNNHKEQIINDIEEAVKKKIQEAESDYQEAVAEANRRLCIDLQREQTKFNITYQAEKMKLDSSFRDVFNFKAKNITKDLFDIAGFTYSGFSVGSLFPVVGNIIGAAIGFLAGIGIKIWSFFASKQSRINRAKEKLKESIDDQISKVTDTIKEEIKNLELEKTINENHSLLQERIERQNEAFKIINQTINTVIMNLKNTSAKIM